MLEVYELSELHKGEDCLELVATFEERQKSRLRTQTRCGRELAWFLERGYVLREGDVLQSRQGPKIKVCCADESVSEVRSEDALLLMRAAYHLGNRHVPLQIETGLLRFQHDHVLDDMVSGLGLVVSHNYAPFQPEAGAYSGSSHSHRHVFAHTPHEH